MFNHPRIVSKVVGPLPNGRTPWLMHEGDPNHLLNGMIFQVGPLNSYEKRSGVCFKQDDILHVSVANPEPAL